MKCSSVIFAFALAGLFAACGGDDKDSTGTKDNSQSKAGSGGSDKDTLSCGSTKCKLPEGVTGTLCCKDQFAGVCGLMSGANCREIPKTDDRCPAPKLNVMFPMPGGTGSGMTVFGCCTSGNECGIDFGAGCQPRTTACSVVGPDQVENIKPMTCDGDALPLPDGCGMNMIRVPNFAGQSGGT
jgi:hypothetical protein